MIHPHPLSLLQDAEGELSMAEAYGLPRPNVKD